MTENIETANSTDEQKMEQVPTQETVNEKNDKNLIPPVNDELEKETRKRYFDLDPDERVALRDWLSGVDDINTDTMHGLRSFLLFMSMNNDEMEGIIKPTIDGVMLKDPVFKMNNKQKHQQQDQKLHQQQMGSNAQTASAVMYLTKLAYKNDEYYHTHVFPALERFRRVVDFDHSEKEILTTIIKPEEKKEEIEGEDEKEEKKEEKEREKSQILKENFILTPNIKIMVKKGGLINFAKKDFPFKNYLESGISKDKAICLFYLKRWKMILQSQFRTDWFVRNNWSEILQTYTLLFKIIELTEGGFNSVKYRHIRDLHYTITFFMSKSWLLEYSSEIIQMEERKRYWEQFGYKRPEWYAKFLKWKDRRENEEARINKIVKQQREKKQKAFEEAQKHLAEERKKAAKRQKKKLKHNGPADPYAEEKEDGRLIKEQEKEEKKKKEILEGAKKMLAEAGIDDVNLKYEEKEEVGDDDIPKLEAVSESSQQTSTKNTKDRLSDLFGKMKKEDEKN